MTANAALAQSRRALLEARLRGGLANAGVGTGSRSHEAIPPHPGPADRPPLSFAQERLWFLDQLTPGSAAYVLPIAVRVRGGLDEQALRRALVAVLARHEPLRTTFPPDGDGSPTAHVQAAQPADIASQTSIETADFTAAAAAARWRWRWRWRWRSRGRWRWRR